MKQATTLFLHGGPGLSAIVERELYGESLPLVWWDQPRTEVLFARPYQALLDDVVFKVEMLASQGGGTIDLVTHSFGAHLALHLAMVMPERLGAITLVAPVFDIADALMRLGERAASVSENPAGLLRAIALNRAQKNSFNALWTLFERICQVPGFLDMYWGPDAVERRQWFNALIEREAWLDFNACHVILKDFMETTPLRVQTTVRGPVNIVFGLHDVLVDPRREAQTWSRYFQNVTIQWLNAGHFVHLECPPELWLPKG
ncbi:alpha/beta hydrolase [Paraburkholderia sp. J63]|uniref:alpha/beta fold hydrolase n=1 Tax=Paraburkholderia sp. J63 TaxID=2805434 RepID=UPI002ABE19B2|nr:alpha/beta hydrolase [Paraburkholderia sp. J63]